MAIRGRFIVIDGSNGAGKSTVMGSIADYLRLADRAAVFTREPGGTPIGERIREILLSTSHESMCDVTELLLFAAARAQHVRQKILPALDEGKIVVSDRFDSATISFQHHARGLPISLIRTLNDIAVDELKPDLTIILDLDPVVGLERIGARGSAPDRMEKEDLAFLARARAGYLKQAADCPDRFRVIDASQSLDQVVAESIKALQDAIGPV